MLNILIVDDNETYCKALKQFIEKKGEYNVFTAYNYDEAINIGKTLSLDIALVDIRLKSDKNGFHVSASLTTINKDTKVVFISFMYSPTIASKVKSSNSFGFIHKDSMDIHDKIKLVLEGQKVYDFKYSNKLNQLSPKEVEVAEMIVKEHTNKEIAESMFISIETVKSHRKNIYSKLDINSPIGLIKLFMNYGSEF